MMGQVTDLKQKFEQYFYEQEGFGLRAERFYADMDTGNAEQMRAWMEAAFLAGCRAMAQDSIDTLRDYATAMAGIDQVKHTAESAFDTAAENLMVYYTQILDDAGA